MISTIQFKDKRIAILGEGIEGLSSAKFLKLKGADVTILDQKNNPNYLENLDEYDLIIRSPGISLKNIIDKNPQVKNKITSQTKLFFDLCPAEIIGVTGTKGKGTTSSLIYEMLKESGKDVYLGGNIGVPPFEFLDKLNTQSFIVLELSSFQLEDLHKSPKIGVMLMITSEHLEHHGGIKEYVEAKRNLIRFQNESDFAVLNRDYLATNESDIYSEGKKFFVSREREVSEGAFARDEALWLRVNGEDKKVIDTSEILIPGKHNWENAGAAIVAAHIAGVSIETMKKVLKTFKGLPHRLELVAEVNGVKYYDDSIATNPESTIAAIQAFKQPKILILGGVTEGSHFDELGKIISEDESIKAIIGIGKEWPQIKSKISSDHILLIEGAIDMHTVAQAAFKIAQTGDVVLLSPACKSFDMFKNYKDRGDQFKEAVLKLRQNLN